MASPSPPNYQSLSNERSPDADLAVDGPSDAVGIEDGNSGTSQTTAADGRLDAKTGLETADNDLNTSKIDIGDSVAIEEAAPPKLTDYEGPFRWVVVVAAFMAMFFAVGSQYAQGTFVRAYFFTDYFAGASLFTISFVGALNSVAFPLFAPFAGPLVGYFGPQPCMIVGAIAQCLGFTLASLATQPWHMILSQGFLFGLGEVLMYMGTINVIQQYFIKKQLGLSLGLVMSGSGFGGFVVSIVAQVLIDQLSIEWALRILGFVFLGVGVTSAIIMKSRVPPGFKSGKGAKGLSLDFTVFKIAYFKQYYISQMISMFGYFVPFYFISSYATSFGVSADTSSLALGLMNVSSAIGRIIAGYLGDNLGFMNIFLASQIACPIFVLLLWPFATTVPLIILFAVLYGTFAGGYISVMPPMLISLFGGGSAVAILGMQMSAGFFASLAGPPIAGAITDSQTTTNADGSKTINWIPTIIFTGGMLLVGNIILLWVRGDKTGWKLRVKI